MAKTASSPILQLIRRVYSDPRVKDSPDQGLLRRFLGERDEAAFEALLRRHGPMVLDVCRGVLGNAADAEDAFQATFLILARKAESIRKAASLASWLHGVAYRTALRARADSARRQRLEARAPQRSPTTDPDELTWREVRQAVHEELARLPERHRAALVLCYLEGKTQDKAAAQLGLAKGTLKGHLERGRALLRARLVRRGLGPGAVLVLGAWPAATRAACLSPPRLVPTVKAATAVAAGGAAASVVSPDVAALTEGMVKTMFFKKLKIAALLFLAIAGSGAGLALAVRGLPHADAGGVIEQPAPQEGWRPDADAGAKRAADMGRPIRSLTGHKERVTSVAYSPDGRWIATAAWDGTARIWDAKTWKEVRRLDVPTFLNQILFSPDSEFIVVAQQVPPNEPRVIVWNRRTGEKVHEFPGLCAAFSPDGKHLACGGRETADTKGDILRLYEFATGKLVRGMSGPYSRVDLLTFAPDGKTLYAQVGIPRPPLGNGMTRYGRDPAQVRVWDVATGKERRTGLEGAWDDQGAWNDHHMTLTPDGRTIAVRGLGGPKFISHNHAGGNVVLRETAGGGRRIELTGHTDDVMDVAFSPDGRTLASASMDKTVRLWDRVSGKEIGRLEGHRHWVLSIAFSPDGGTLVSGGLDKTALVWDVRKITRRRGESVERSSAELEADWKDLGGDAAKGYAAVGRLVSSPGRGVAFLGKQLQSTKPVDTKRIERLIADLDDERFQVRQQATRDLEALAERAAPALRKMLAGKPSLEVTRRLGALLDRLDGASPSAETVRQIRAVEALEFMGNAEARRLLDKLAAGPAETPLTQAAKAAAGRLAKRASVAP